MARRGEQEEVTTRRRISPLTRPDWNPMKQEDNQGRWMFPQTVPYQRARRRTAKPDQHRAIQLLLCQWDLPCCRHRQVPRPLLLALGWRMTTEREAHVAADEERPGKRKSPRRKSQKGQTPTSTKKKWHLDTWISARTINLKSK